MTPYLSLMLGVVAGLIGAYYARERGRRPEVWFFVGLLFGLLGLLVLFLLPRFDEEGGQQEQLAGVEQTPVSEVPDPRFQDWFFLDDRRCQQGPVPFRQLIGAWRDRVIHQESYVWTEGMPTWEPIRQLPLLLEKLK